MVGSQAHLGKGVPRYPPWLQKALKTKEEAEQFWLKQQEKAESQKQKQQRPVSKSRTSAQSASGQAALKKIVLRSKQHDPFVSVWASIAADDAQAVETFLDADHHRFFMRKDFLRNTGKGIEGNGGGESLLHEASYLGSVRVVRMLIAFMQTHFTYDTCQNAVNAIDTQYSLTTPMIATCRNSLGSNTNRVEILQLLLEADGDTAHCDSHGDTVLHWCARNSRVALLRYLLKHTDAAAVALSIQNYKRCTPLDIAKLQLECNRCLSTVTVYELLKDIDQSCNLRLNMLRFKRKEALIRARNAAHVQEQLAVVLETSERIIPKGEKLWRDTLEIAERHRKAEVQQHVDAAVKAAGTAARQWLETKDGKLFVKKQIPLATADTKQAVLSGKLPKPKDIMLAAKQRVQDLYCVEKEQSAKKSAIENFVSERPPYPRDRVAELRHLLHL